MKIHRTAVATAIATVLGSTNYSAQAALTNGSVLEFSPGTTVCTEGGTPPDNCTYGAIDIAGSYYAFDTDDSGTILPNEKIPMSMFDGIILGATQPAAGSHGGAPDGTESPGIDSPWSFLGNTGMHQSLSPVTVVNNDVNNDGGFTKTLDFSGWGMTWNGIPNIPLGGGTQDCGTASDGICVTGPSDALVDLAGTIDNGSGLATITCSTASCSTSSIFTLSYAATVTLDDPSNFGGVPYSLYLEGHVGAVPIPAAAWLFCSGLLGLVGMASRKNQK